MEYYVEQLDAVTALIKAINAWEKANPDCEIVLAQPITVVSAQDPDCVLGHLVDEVGGAWAFRPAVAA